MENDETIINTMTITVGLAIVLLYGQGCMVLAGTPSAIKAYGDYQVGTQKTAKESPDSENQYFKMRTKSFWEKLTEDAPTQPTQEEQGS